MSKKTQSSLDAFLGVKSNHKLKQTKIKFGGGAAKKKSSQQEAKPSRPQEAETNSEEKENNNNVVLEDTDDDEQQEPPKPMKRQRQLGKKKRTLQKLKRQKLEKSKTPLHDDEDDDEEELEQEEEDVVAKKHEEEEEEAVEMEEAIEETNESNEKKKKAANEKDENEENDDDDSDEEFQLDDAQDQEEEEDYLEEEDDDVVEEAQEEESKEPSAKPKATKKSLSSLKQAPKKKSTQMVIPKTSNEQLKQQIAVKSNKGSTRRIGYGALCDAFEAIEAISGRLEIQKILTDLFRTTLLQHQDDLYHLIYLASNSVAPAYECIELGIGDAILIKAIGQAYGTNPNIIKQKYESQGDLGTVAMMSKGKQRTLGFGAKPKPLLAHEVLEAFRQIAKTTGSQSQKAKVDTIKGLLVRAQQGSEAKYIIRGLQGKLRIGLAQSTVLVSLAHALTLTVPESVKESKMDDDDNDDYPEEAKMYADKTTPTDKRLEAAVAIVKKAYSEVPSFDCILDAGLVAPLQDMHKVCSLKPGVPVVPMLAKPTKSIQEVLKRLSGQRFTCEFKYDGERAQVHMLADGTTRVFSRNLLETTVKFPEVPLYVKAAAEAAAATDGNEPVNSFVLDTEVVAFNRETGQFVPFQVLSTRKKTEESDETATVQVIVQAFDLMYLNGVPLLNRSLAERRDLLKKHFRPVESKFQFATSLDHKEDGDTTVLEEFLETAVKGQCEGLMVKTLDANAAYEPSRRSLNWLKLKKDYLEGLGDSVDLVPLGAYHGRGKRTGVYGAYLLACYDAETEEFQSVCKIGTGFSEEDLKTLAESLKGHIVPEKSSQYNVSDTLECDVWFDAVQVWEIKAADLSKSSTHRGAVGRTGERDRGIGLRFPRFERVRPDKKPEEATSSDQILDMYYQQDSVVAEEGADNMDDDGI